MANIFTVSNTNYTPATAQGNNLLLNIKNPLSKLDTTNIVSFQTVNILFSNEPTNPTAGGLAITTVYSFPHGYSYIPSVTFTWQNKNANPTNFPSTAPGTALRTLSFNDDTASSLDTISAVNSGTQYNLTNVLASTIYQDAFFTSYIESVAQIAVAVDSTNVKVQIIKRNYDNTGGNPNINIAGITLKMRFYVFTEPATTSNY